MTTIVWEQRKLLDCIQKITDFRGRTPKKLGMEWSDHGYLALSALNVKEGYIDFSQDVHYGDRALYEKWMTGNELHKGQVLFTTEAPMGNVAQIPDNKQYILSQRVIAFDVQPSLITESFLATLLRSPLIFSVLSAISSGGTAKGVSQKSLATVEVTLPSNMVEQDYLVNLFSYLDNLITLHQRKFYKLKKFNKFIFKIYFLKNNIFAFKIQIAKSPYAWEQRELGSVCNSLEYGLNAAAMPYDGRHKYIRITDIDDETRAFSQKDMTSPNTPLDNAKRYQLHQGDIVFARTGASVGKTYLYDKQDGIVYYAGFLIRARVNGGVSPDFIFQATLSEQYSRFITITSQRSGQPGVNAQEYSEWQFFIPKNPKEQQKIGSFFRNLDRLITLHQREYLLLEVLLC